MMHFTADEYQPDEFHPTDKISSVLLDEETDSLFVGSLNSLYKLDVDNVTHAKQKVFAII